MNMSDTILKNRLRELAERASVQNRYTFTDFLSESELSVYYEIKKELSYINTALYGGAPGCDRQMIRFGSEELFGYGQSFPITCIKIEPVAEKFAGVLSHRDYLGALMHLGIEREVLGDILIRGKHAYLFCMDTMAEYISNHLSQIGRTSVVCSLAEEIPKEATRELVAEHYILSSERLDLIVAKLCRLSRSESQKLFQDKRIFLNGKVTLQHSGKIEPEDILSVRGYGKYIFKGIIAETKKGNLRIEIMRYG